MVTNKTYEYGIKYRTIKVDENKYLLFPVGLEGGLSDGLVFSTGEKGIPILKDKCDLRNKYLISKVFATEDLEKMYHYDQDTDVLGNSFFDSYKDVLLLVDSTEDKVKISEIDLKEFTRSRIDSTCYINNEFSVMLTEDTLNKLMECEDIGEMKLMLEAFKRNIDGVKRVVDGKEGKEHERDVDKNTVRNSTKPGISTEVTYNGLRNAIKERIFGHDKEIDKIAQKLYMNYMARKGDTISTILLIGPSGTGKTETINIAANYMNLPFVSYNASKLVRNGIKGKTAEKLLIDLYHASGNKKELAERGIFFLDEFDKLANSSFDMNDDVKSGLLTLIGGEQIVLDGIEGLFDTTMLSKVGAGVFERLSAPTKQMGFGNSCEGVVHLESSDDLRRKIIQEKYFTEEEISRFKVLLRFDKLDLETKRNILLSAKGSELINKRRRYKEQFGIDLLLTDDFIDAVFENLPAEDIGGMRGLNIFVEEIIDEAEEAIISDPNHGYKKLLLTRDIVTDHSKFDLS